MSVPEAIDLFASRLGASHSEAEGPRLALPLFTLDTTTLSQPNLACVQKIFSRCILEKLVIKCDRIDLNMSKLVARALDSVHWSLLENLWLSGDDINQWLQLLANIDTPRLTTLQIRGTRSQQELSHASVLSIERLIGSSSLAELYFNCVLLQDQRDWVRLVDKMDPSMLENFGLGEGSFQQFMATPDAKGLEHSKRVKWRRQRRGITEE
ncbi:hypothetical protein BGZ74_000940 [Mortierella antarctica]|nr:hypothetical protein BGZ74_000940 [Mortierella antarctica]